MPGSFRRGLRERPHVRALRVLGVAGEEVACELEDLRVVAALGVDLDAQGERLGSELAARKLDVVAIELLEGSRAVARLERGAGGVERGKLGEEAAGSGGGR